MERVPLSSATMAKLASNKAVQTDIISRICLTLDCRPGDIMESLRDKTLTVSGESTALL